MSGKGFGEDFLNAPRREDGKLVAMEIPAVYRRLGLEGG